MKSKKTKGEEGLRTMQNRAQERSELCFVQGFCCKGFCDTCEAAKDVLFITVLKNQFTEEQTLS